MCIKFNLLSSPYTQDYVDAFEKLLHLGLKEVQEREIIHVLLDCCLQETTFNPYYAHLGQKFCEFKRSHQVTFQYALWDRFKALSSLTKSNRINLRKLLCHLVSNKSLSLSVLKVSKTILYLEDLANLTYLRWSILGSLKKLE